MSGKGKSLSRRAAVVARLARTARSLTAALRIRSVIPVKEEEEDEDKLRKSANWAAAGGALSLNDENIKNLENAPQEGKADVPCGLEWCCDVCGRRIKDTAKAEYGEKFRDGGPSFDFVPEAGTDFFFEDKESNEQNMRELLAMDTCARQQAASWVPRWTCTVCIDFDMCAKCYADQQNDNSVSRRFEELQQQEIGGNFSQTKTSGHLASHKMQLEQVVPDALHSSVGAKPSMAAVIDAMFTVFADRWCLGERAPATGVGGNLGEYRWRTYAEVGARTHAFAAGLRELVPAGSRIAICGPNCEEWLVADFACQLQGLVSVPLHTTATSDEMRMILEDAAVEVVVCCADQFRKIARGCRGLSAVKYVVTWSPYERVANDSADVSPYPLTFSMALRESSAVTATADRTRAAMGAADLKMSSSAMISLGAAVHAVVDTLAFSEVEELGSVSPLLHIPEYGAPDDLITIIYTSGSTGKPKGVMLTDVFYRRDICKHYSTPRPYCMLSFLPLAHATDRTVCSIVLVNGGRMGFCSGDLGRLLDDVQALRPVQFGSTPRFFHMLHSDWVSRVQELERKFAAKHDVQASDELPTLRRQAEDQAYAEYRLILGNRCDYVSTGGAATSPAVMQWMRRCFTQMQVGEGYGATECGNIAVNGYLRSDIKWKIESVPEMGYHAPVRGELCVITDSMFVGYFHAADQTNDAIDADGYYHTGDIVWVLPSAYDCEPARIEIIDRKKNFFKLSQGVFVAPDRIENIFVGESEFIDQIFIHGTSDSSFLAAVLVPNLSLLTDWYQREVLQGYDLTPPSEWLDSEEVAEKLLLEMRNVARAKSLRSFEVPRRIFVEPSRFSGENRLLTPSEKPCRPQLRQHYAEVLETLLRSADQADSCTDDEEGNIDDSSSDEEGNIREDLSMIEARQVRAKVIAVLSRICCVKRSVLRKQHREDILRLRELCVDSLTAVRVVRSFREHENPRMRVSIPLELIYDEEARLDTLVAWICSHGKTGSAGQVDRAETDLSLSARAVVRMGADNLAPAKSIATSPISDEEMLEEVKQQFRELKANIASRNEKIATRDASQADKAIFLTGATGFVGAFLLAELVRCGKDLFGTTKIICLVRAQDMKQGSMRLRRVLRDLSLPAAGSFEADEWLAPEGCIEVISGDLALPQFGLSDTVFLSLASRVVTIVHCGAYVNAILPFSVLGPANISGTRTCLELAYTASQFRSKEAACIGFHFVSTLSVTAEHKPVEAAVLDPTKCPRGGYPQTKWVADQLVVQALGMGSVDGSLDTQSIQQPLSRIIPTVFRYGNVSAHSRSGASNLIDYQTRFILGCAQLGAFPDVASTDMTFSPVDHVAATTLSIAASAQKAAFAPSKFCSHVYHIVNPNGCIAPALVGNYIATFPSLPQPVTCRSCVEWLSLLRSDKAVGNALEPLLSYFASGSLPNDSPVPCERVLRSGSVKGFHAVDESYFHSILDWLLHSGALVGSACQ